MAELKIGDKVIAHIDDIQAEQIILILSDNVNGRVDDIKTNSKVIGETLMYTRRRHSVKLLINFYEA